MTPTPQALDLAAYAMAITYLNMPDTNFILDGVLVQGEAKQELANLLYLRYKALKAEEGVDAGTIL
jgi:hypothetical protein